MYQDIIAYHNYWISFAVAVGTVLAAAVTAFMAYVTREMAKATREMAESARDELEFMRAETDERTKAYTRIIDVRANVDHHFNVSGSFTVLNVGPSRSYNLRWRGWYAFEEHIAVVGRGETMSDDAICLEAGQQRPEPVRLELPQGTADDWLPRVPAVNDPLLVRERERIIRSPKVMWLLLTWKDEADNRWAHLLQLEGRVDECSFGIRQHWPSANDRGERLDPNDLLFGPDALPDADLLAEVRRRLADTSQITSSQAEMGVA